jgi:hypothetical protein
LVRPLAGSPLTTISYLGAAEAHVVRQFPIFWTRFDFWKANLKPLWGEGALIRRARSMGVPLDARGIEGPRDRPGNRLKLLDTFWRGEALFFNILASPSFNARVPKDSPKLRRRVRNLAGKCCGFRVSVVHSSTRIPASSRACAPPVLALVLHTHVVL